MKDYSIGIVTYHARYDKYFVPLVKKLSEIFPDKEIICILNGHPDRTLQINYLNKATSFLRQIPNVRYVTYDQHQSLSKCWNQLVILSRTDNVLIMNDDTQVTELFREELEKKIISKDLPFSTINSSWSHFIISKSRIKEVGWFDERLLGVGHEDADYALRTVMTGLQIVDTTCLGLNNYVVGQEDAGWKDISKKSSTNKYSEVNYEFFKTKWWHNDIDPDYKDWKYSFKWNGIDYKFSPKTDEQTPMFYDFSVLDTKIESFSGSATRKQNKLKSITQKAFYSSREIAKKIYRKIRY